MSKSIVIDFIISEVNRNFRTLMQEASMSVFIANYKFFSSDIVTILTKSDKKLLLSLAIPISISFMIKCHRIDFMPNPSEFSVDKIRRYLEEHPEEEGLTLRGIAEKTGFSYQTIRKHRDEIRAALEKQKRELIEGRAIMTPDAVRLSRQKAGATRRLHRANWPLTSGYRDPQRP